MARFDAYNSECLLFSFKDGLLARLAHDLKLQVERFSIEVEDSTRQINATFDPSSIQVVCAQVDGLDDPSTLSQGVALMASARAATGCQLTGVARGIAGQCPIFKPIVPPRSQGWPFSGSARS